ncbi:helix-turn-helix transcriptional regulator [Singulisphaera rosea]
MSLISQDFLTAQELADLKGVTLKTVYSWVDKGRSPPYERFAGRNWFYRKPAEAFQPPKRGRKATDENR